MNFDKNFFQLFRLPVQFALDAATLSNRYRELQREIHPDRFAGKGDREQRLAVQYATHVNEAFETLKSPLQRAEYLLSLAGLSDDGQQTTSDMGFLMQQMALRDELSEVREQADPEAALDALSAHVERASSQLQNEFADCFSGGDLEAAQALVHKLHFITKLAHEVEQLEAELFDY